MLQSNIDGALLRPYVQTILKDVNEGGTFCLFKEAAFFFHLVFEYFQVKKGDRKKSKVCLILLLRESGVGTFFGKATKISNTQYLIAVNVKNH